MGYLDKINSYGDIKKIDKENLPELCGEIRSFIIEAISKTGGHLASNLGVVELTAALHYCFDFTKDKIVWDVGHQSYVHKILTGRKDLFGTLRQFGGLSGFPKTTESRYDFFDTGHSSTSISAGLGLAVSRDLNKEAYSVVSVIGDGSMTGGLAFEGLNNAGNLKTNFMVILNDNEMSISENVGALSRHLTNLRAAPKYQRAKKEVKYFLDKIPLIGNGIGQIMEQAKNGLRYLLVKGTLFEEIGFTYVGPVDGHDIFGLIDILNKAKEIKGPVLLHVITKKGKGYYMAEASPCDFHGVAPFDAETGLTAVTGLKETYTDVFSETLVEIAKKNKKVLAVTASMQSGTGLEEFGKRFPERLFDVGISEGHAATFAAGLAKNGFVPVVAIYSTFLQRAYDQILHDICIQKLPVVLAVDRAGIVGADGETHQGIFDLSFLSHIPNMVIIAPKNKQEFISMLKFAIGADRPVAIRYPKAAASNVLVDFNANIALGKHEMIYKGGDVALISVGAMMDTAYEVYERLTGDGLSVTLINARFIKPIDAGIIEDIRGCGYIFTVEDNVLNGGYYSGLSIITEGSFNITPFAFPNTFIEQGSRGQLIKKYGLDAESIYIKIKNKIKVMKNE